MTPTAGVSECQGGSLATGLSVVVSEIGSASDIKKNE